MKSQLPSVRRAARSPSNRVAVGFAFLAIAFAFAHRSAAQETLQISIRAVGAPFGQPGGTIAEGSGAVDGRPDGRLTFVSSLNELGAPAGAGGDNFAFTGSVEYQSGLPNVRRGLFARLPQSPNALTLAIYEGGAAGTTGGFTGQIGGVNIDHLNDVVFWGVWEKTTNPTAGGTGIWWSDAALSSFLPPVAVALSGSPAPETGQNFGGMNAGTLYHTGRFIGFISGGLGNWTYRKSTGQLQRVTYTGMPVEALGAGLTLSNAGQVLGLADSGRFLILGQTNAGTANAKSHLFLASAPDAITPILSTGDPAPGVAGRTISFLAASINDGGDVAISALLDDGDGMAFNNISAIYFWRSTGTLELVTHGGAPIAGLPTGIWGGTPLVNSARVLYLPGLGVIDPAGGEGATPVFTSIPLPPESINAAGFAFNRLGQVVTYVQSPVASLWFYHPGAGWQKLAKAGEVFTPSGNPNPVVTIRVNVESGGSDGKPTGLTEDGNVVFTVDGRYVAVARMAHPDIVLSSGMHDFPVLLNGVGTLDVSGTATANFTGGVNIFDVIVQTGGAVLINGNSLVVRDFTFTEGTQGGTGTTTIEGPATLGGPITFDGRTFLFKTAVDFDATELTMNNAAKLVLDESAILAILESVRLYHGDNSAAAFENNGTIINGEPGGDPAAVTTTIDTPFIQGPTGSTVNHDTLQLRGDVDIKGTFENIGEVDFMGWRAFWQGLLDEAINKGFIRVGHDDEGREILIITELDNQGPDARMEINDAEVRIEYARPDQMQRLDLKLGAKYELHRAPDATGSETLLDTDEVSITGPGNEVIFVTPGSSGDHTWRVNSHIDFNPGGAGSLSGLALTGVSYVAAEGATITNSGVTLIELSESSWRVDGSWTLGNDVMVKKHDALSYFGVYGDMTVPQGRTISVKDAAEDDATLFIRGLLQLGGTVDANLKAKGSPLPLIISEVRIGSSPGNAVVNGDMTLAPLSRVFFEVGGTQQGVSYDHLDVNGTLAIDSGEIDVRFTGGFESAVAPGDVFVLAEADAPITGSFANALNGARYNTSDGLRSFEIHYGDGSAHGANRVVATNFGAPVAGPPPALSAQPGTKTAVIGGSATFTVQVTGSGPFTYQWMRNGVVLPGETGPSLTITNIQPGHSGSYSVVVSNATGSVTSSAGSVILDTTPRLINVSCRGLAGAGDNTLVMGFYITGTGSKTLLIRGIGPKLADFIPGEVVADPRITVYHDTDPVDGVDDWDASLVAAFSQMGAFPLNTGSKDAAMTVTLPAGGYTVHLVNEGPVAEGLIEVYDLSRDLGSRLTNVSCRFNMQAGQTIILGTASIGGPTHVLARNIGPGIAQYLQNPLDALPDPHLRLYTGNTEIAVNDDWEPATGAWFGPVGAFGLDAGSKDAAIRVPLAVGGHTIHATGNGGSGVAIIEVYESRDP